VSASGVLHLPHTGWPFSGDTRLVAPQLGHRINSAPVCALISISNPLIHSLFLKFTPARAELSKTQASSKWRFPRRVEKTLCI
jgi:hypothetical protein